MKVVCDAKNSDVNIYKFYKDTVQIGGDRKNNTYIVDHVKFSDAGSYTCKSSIDSVSSYSSNSVSVTG